MSNEIHHCPNCGTELKHRDYKRRVMKIESGIKSFIQIERLKCSKCQRLHNALPDFLVPNKHYTSEVISGVLDEIITPKDLDGEDYPCEETMKRWHRWFRSNQDNIDGHLKSVGYRLLGFSVDLLKSKISLLTHLRMSSQLWLEIILRFIYNSGGSLVVV